MLPLHAQHYGGREAHTVRHTRKHTDIRFFFMSPVHPTQESNRRCLSRRAENHYAHCALSMLECHGLDFLHGGYGQPICLLVGGRLLSTRWRSRKESQVSSSGIGTAFPSIASPRITPRQPSQYFPALIARPRISNVFRPPRIKFNQCSFRIKILSSCLGSVARTMTRRNFQLSRA